MYEHFFNDGHNGFIKDVVITLIDKTDGKDPKNRENYWLRTLKMLGGDGPNIEDWVRPNTIYTNHNKIQRFLVGRQYIRIWMELGFHGMRTAIFGNNFILFILHYFFLYYVSVCFSLTDVFLILLCLLQVIFLYVCFVSRFRTMKRSGTERLCEIASSL